MILSNCPSWLVAIFLKLLLISRKKFTNFELSCQWRHRQEAGNSGIFVWATDDSIEQLAKSKKPGLPQGIEVQVLDLEYGGENKVIHVPQGHFYVLGDNSANSMDSRYWGFVPDANLVGEAFVVHWPIKRIRLIKNE